MEIKIPYYEDLTRISNSNIGWFLNKGPAYLHKMLTDPPPEEKNYALERGSLIHMYILQPEEFKNTYVVWDKLKPSSAQQEKFCQELANTVEIEPNKAILSAYKEAYSTKGKTEENMLSEGSKIASTLKEYIGYLKDPERKQMISPGEYQMLKKIEENIRNHRLAKFLVRDAGIIDLTHDMQHNFSRHHEFHINWEWGDVKCKSLLDSVGFDIDFRKCVIMDLKTTQKLWHFEDSINQYDYLRQLMYYTMAARWYINNELNDDSTKWEFEYYIIGIDTTGTYEIRVFKIDEDMVHSRSVTITNALIDIAWHQKNNKWEHSRAYYEGDGSETLNL